MISPTNECVCLSKRLTLSDRPLQRIVSEPRMTSIFTSMVARCPGESDVCGSTC